MQEFADSAGWHTQISELLRKRVCDKLLVFEKESKKELKARQQPVEKAYQGFNDECSSMLKSKLRAHAKSKDLETAAQYVDEVQRNEAGKFGPKDTSKVGATGLPKGRGYADKWVQQAQKALDKAQASRDKAGRVGGETRGNQASEPLCVDDEYKASLKKLQLAQEDWETASISGFKVGGLGKG